MFCQAGLTQKHLGDYKHVNPLLSYYSEYTNLLSHFFFFPVRVYKGACSFCFHHGLD